MAGITDSRRRLSDLMEQRRLELGLRWKQVAEAGGISYESIRAIRSGTADMRSLTRHGIETGLRWEPGSVERILTGGDPAPLATARRQVPDLPPAPEGEPFTVEVLAALAPRATAIIRRLDEVRQDGIPNPSGRQMFPDSRELALGWDAMRAAGFTPEAGLWYLAAAIVEREAERRDEDRDRSGTHGA